MIFFRRVSGDSMAPALRDTQVIVANSRLPKLGEIAVARHSDLEIIKRVHRIGANTYWLEGENTAHSTDSRDFGWVDKSAILGTMKFAFAVAEPAPKLRDKRGGLYGWLLAGLMIVFALIHLFRIDTFVPELAQALGNRDLAGWAGSLIVTMEVFALPFLLRVRLSLLAQYVSGAFATLVPLVWLLIALWTFGTPTSTAQLGEFVSLPSSWLLLVGNASWLAASYYGIWALGYDRRAGDATSLPTRLLRRLSK